MDLDALLEHRLLLVTGKGGTGKTTYAAALAVLAAAKGKRVIVAEVDTQISSMDSIFQTKTEFKPKNVRHGLDVCNIRWEFALESFLHRVVPVRRVVRMILRNKIVNRFLDFTPGSRELVTLSIIGQLVESYDLVIVDMPASGHAFSLLDILRSAMGLFRSGPVLTHVLQLQERFRDASTRLVLVALPEEMVVNETLETYHRMRRAGMLTQKPVVFLNRATLPSLTEPERELISRLSSAELPGHLDEFVVAGSWEDQLEQATMRSQLRLAERLDDQPMLVPPAGAGGVPNQVVGSVAAHLGRNIGLTRRKIAWT